ncbi:MAG: coenzyme F420-0:L-glutamate ligase [Dehalococcoidia bacterium]
MNNVIFIPVLGMPEINVSDNIPELIIDCLKKNEEKIMQNDILVITQKIVSKAEDRIIDLKSIKPTKKALNLSESLNKDARLIQLILNESKSIVKLDKERGIIITENNNGHISANSGIDFSNIKGENNASLLPVNPDASAKKFHDYFINKLTTNNVGIIISDTFGRPWRIGQTNISIGSYGINPFVNYINKKDTYGEQLNSTNICLVDELAGGAEILMGKTMNVPVVVVRGLNFEFSKIGSSEILRDKDKDLFR